MSKHLDFPRGLQGLSAFAVSLVLAGAAALPTAHAGNEHQRDGDHRVSQGRKGVCDDKLVTAFAPNRDAQVLLIKAFKAGEPIALSSTPATPAPPVAPVDVCLIKVLVGPGHPGTEGAPSTSKGIGIEIWLPAPEHWNGRIRDIGSGGWAGGDHRRQWATHPLRGHAEGSAGSVADGSAR